MDLLKIHRMLLLLGVFALGVLMFVLLQKPHTVCDTQIEYLRQTQSGAIFPKPTKSVPLPPAYEKAIANCKLGMASPGACYQYFHILRGLMVDLRNVGNSCGGALMSVEEVQRALHDGVVLMVQMAWGESPPEKGQRSTGPLEAPELALFCALKDAINRYGDAETWEKVKTDAIAKLPGVAPHFETTSDGRTICLNCEEIPSAEKALGGREEVFLRSLLSIRCENYG